MGVFEPERKGLNRDSLSGEGSGAGRDNVVEPEPGAEPRSEVDLEREWAELAPAESCDEPDELRERDENETECCSPGRAGGRPGDDLVGAGDDTRDVGRDDGRELERALKDAMRETIALAGVSVAPVHQYL